MIRDDVERLFHLLILKGALEERHVTNASKWTNTYIKLGPSYKDVLGGKIEIVLSSRPGSGKASKLSRAKGRASAAPKTVEEQIEDYVEDDSDIEVIDHPSQAFPPPRGAAARATAAATATTTAGEGSFVSTRQSASRMDPATACHQDLVKLRRDLATDNECETAAVFSDEMLQLIACMRPQSRSPAYAPASHTGD